MTIAKRMTVALALTLGVGCSAGDDAAIGESGDDSELGSTPDEGSGLGTAQEAAIGTITIACPRSTSATWIQALNGTVDLISGQTSSFGIPGGTPTTTLKCLYGPSAFPQILDHTVSTGPAGCGARATFSGAGQQIGGVPPFGGWQFKSKRVTATATYNDGACRLQLPVVGPPTMLLRDVTQPCTPIQGGYSCPATVLPR